jgi:hypothetical protein
VAFVYDVPRMLEAGRRAVAEFRARTPAPPAEPKAVTLSTASARIACRIEAREAIACETTPERDATRRLWVLSKCRACGLCADMVAG